MVKTVPLTNEETAAIEKYRKTLHFVLAYLRKTEDVTFDKTIKNAYAEADREIDRLKLAKKPEYFEAVKLAHRTAREVEEFLLAPKS
jgi:hypothetical protein